MLGRVANPNRPVVLAIHPGTRRALELEGVGLGPEVRLVEPQGYRTSLTLQLHAAAVLTDSGGVQREAAWLGVPCLVLRDTTEWVEAVADAGGRIVVVGLDGQRAETRWPSRSLRAPWRSPGGRNRRRCRAAKAIVAALESGRTAPGCPRPVAGGTDHSASNGGPFSVVMFVYNDVSRDSRVLREARSLAEAGLSVTVIGRPRSPTSGRSRASRATGRECSSRCGMPGGPGGIASGPGGCS